ncbi:Proton channel OtopLc [Chionoecetes opilio]|uniref:Proton channel OtopLc n=1 Tax=Chionoecetes opilio TaxID=41210 RepID=A0A8J4YXZ2_CHIOP|nr:Proton channel OtopLc [Chionoecetes opilio]
MNSLDLPDGRHPSLDYNNYRKTRRNSMNEIFRRVSGSQTNLQLPIPSHNMRRSSSRTSLEPSMVAWREEGNDSLIACVSALYGKLLVVMGMAFPVAEVISHDIPISFYNGFYLYLYIGSIVFLVYAYVFLLQTINIPTSQLKSKFQSLRRMTTKDSRFDDKESDRASINTMSFKPPKYALTESNNHGSMYLKMGAVVFGIGSMIYSGLEVGQYFELQADDSCADILLVISPAARMLFTFIQMYFIFLNSRVAISRHRIIARFGLMHMIGTNLCIWLNVLVQETKHEIINIHFGHGDHHGVRGTNLSTGHHAEAAVLGGHGHGDDHGLVPHDDLGAMRNESQHDHEDHEVSNSSHTTGRLIDHGQVFSIYECSRSKLMGELVDNASPFLFPCTIEYSLLCAGQYPNASCVLYVVWNNINKPVVTCDGDSDISTYVARKARHHYSVDCAHANRGLFMGILILVLTIISLILFFVLINNEDYKSIAIMEGNIIELLVYGVATVTVVVGMIQMRELEFVPEGDIELDNILLLIAQTGVYIYTSFTIIGGHFTMSVKNNPLAELRGGTSSSARVWPPKDSTTGLPLTASQEWADFQDRAFMVLPLLSAIITLTQTTLQTIFILDATRRCCYNHDQLERKPGREMADKAASAFIGLLVAFVVLGDMQDHADVAAQCLVTFLLVCNLAMWAINTFETSRADAHPTQLNFYGIWAWTIISHISMPLAIFYRFHVTTLTVQPPGGGGGVEGFLDQPLSCLTPPFCITVNPQCWW